VAKEDRPSTYVLDKLVEGKWEYIDKITAHGRKEAARFARERGCPNAGGTWRLRAQ
jgi:hypothetical protein